MIIIRAIAFLLHFSVVPTALGRLITHRKKTDSKKRFCEIYIIGFALSLAIFYLLHSGLVWFQFWNTFNKPFIGCFTALCISYTIIVGVLVLISCIRERKKYRSWIKNSINHARQFLQTLKSNRYMTIYLLAFLLILLAQTYYGFFFQTNRWSYDDYDYVVNSQDILSSDTLSYVNHVTGEMPFLSEKRAVSSWPAYISYLAKVSGFEVTTICHSILPVILLFVAYVVIFYVATFLFFEFENQLIFMLLASVSYIYGLYSHYSYTFRLLGAIWQGKAVLAVIILPFLTLFLFDIYKDPKQYREYCSVAVLSLAGCSLTAMAAFIVGLAVVLVWIVMCVFHRRIVGLRYLAMSLLGPLFLSVYYVLISELAKDMSGVREPIFRRGRDINWWYKWFG